MEYSKSKYPEIGDLISLTKNINSNYAWQEYIGAIGMITSIKLKNGKAYISILFPEIMKMHHDLLAELIFDQCNLYWQKL